MIWLILGLALWIGAHLFKRVAPDARARLGDRGKGIVAVLIVLSVVLMVIGYRSYTGPILWVGPDWFWHLNNLLVLFAFYLFAASAAKLAVTRWIRHPQLTAVGIWAVAHLMVNGDLASLILFGTLLVWAIAEVQVINAAEGRPAPPPPAGTKKEVRGAVIAVVVFVVVGLLHGWLGAWPFGGPG